MDHLVGPHHKVLQHKPSKTTVVSLDDDSRTATRVIMDKYFDSGYLKVRTVTGDSYFERGLFSRKSRYWDSDDSDW